MLHALGGILLRAVPTFLLVILLHFYLKSIFFKPLEKVLHQRYEATEGARKLAEQSLQQAAAKTAQYESAVARGQGRDVPGARAVAQTATGARSRRRGRGQNRADAAVKLAKTQLAADVEAAKTSLAADSESLADQIAETILRRNAA